MIKMFDASRPPAIAPGGYRAVAGYIGGDTPHVWTAQEWQRFGNLPKLPIYVRSDPAANDPMANLFEALAQCYRLRIPRGTAIVLDLELAVDPVYVNTFYHLARFFGYHVWVYGSASTVFKNPRCDGYWVADYRGIGPFMHSGRNVRATQYEAGGLYDSSLIKYWSWAHRLWR